MATKLGSRATALLRGSLGWRGLASAAVFVVGAYFVFQACRGASAEASLFSPPRAAVHVPPALEGLPLRNVALRSKEGADVRGWYIPSRNGAAVVLAHGSGANRSQLSTEARLLADDGFGIVAFDWPGHGESSGRVTYGPAEREALRSMVHYAASRPEVDAKRVGALGFSIGAALLAVTAPDEPGLRSIALVSCFADSDEQTRDQFREWRFLMQWPAVWVDHWYMPDAPLRPVDAVRRLGRRPLLVVAATEDEVVPSWMSAEVYAAAEETDSREWVLVPHSGHGGLDALVPGPYHDAVLRFFRTTLGVR